MKNFSSESRNSFIKNQDSETYDLVIIGGGITGAGILLDACLRGLKVILLEKQDFGSGTSSRSTKLIHGGLRYLKNLEFKLVAEVGRERAIVYENGRHITRAEPMLLPIVKNGSLSKFSAGLGVWLYDRLAGVKKQERRKLLSSTETSQCEPLLNGKEVTGGVLYYEYRTDDSRLTIEIIKEAVNHGAIALNYSEVTDFILEGGKVKGVKVKDQLSDQSFSIKGSAVVNAGGPWVDKIISMDDPSRAGKLFVTKGVHIVVDYKKLPVKQSAYFDVGDKRMIFVIPRDGITYIGTTDTPYQGDFENPRIDKQDVLYLLDAVNKTFKNLNLEIKDVKSGWAGLRPLIRQEGKSASEISRKDEIFINQSGLISIAGGKLTGYRKMAMKIVDLVVKKLSKESGCKFSGCKTASWKLSGGQWTGAKNYMQYISQLVEEGKKSGLNDQEAQYIAEHYGSNSSQLFEIAKKKRREAEDVQLPLGIFVRLCYGIEFESVLTPVDFFVRRTAMVYLYPEMVKEYKARVNAVIQKKCNWNDSQMKKFDEELELQLQYATVYI